MKRIFGFGKKRKGQPPPGSASLPCPAGAYELRQKDLGKLHRAAASGDLAQVRQGLRKYGIDGRDKAERTALHLACANGHVDVVMYLVENKCKLNLFDNDNRTPLMKAVQCQQEKCVAILLERGADPNLADADGNTALHLAVLPGNTTVAGLLLEHNANIDAQNKEGFTPLILAVSEHHEEVVEFLLKKGADVHARDQCERTPLMTAASGGELNLIKVLLRYGADVSHKDTNGWTAEDYAVIHGYSSLSKQLAEYADWENAGEASTGGGARGITALGTPHRAAAAGFTLGAPAVDRGGMQQSPNQTSRTGKSRKAIDDFSQGDSIRSSEKEGSDDSWHTSEEEELDFTPKKLQKPNLTLLMNASQQFRKNNDGDGSRIESPKSPKKSLKQRIPSGANVNKGDSEEQFNQDVPAASNLDEELEEEEGEEEEEEEDENDSGDGDEDYEEEEEEEDDDEDFTEDEKEEEELEDEETQSNEILAEEKTEPKGEINQQLEYFSKTKYEGDAQCGTGDVCDDDEISKEHDENVEESFDTPVSFIAGSSKRSQENKTAVSPKIMNNEISCKSVPKQAVFQNLNNLQDMQESWNRKSMIEEKFHRNANSCFSDSEMTDWKKEIPQPLLDSSGVKEKKSNISDGFESSSNSWLAEKTSGLEGERPASVILEHVDDEDTEEEEYEGVDDKVCKLLKQDSENLHLNKQEENWRAAFHSSTEEESSKHKEQEEGAGKKLQATAAEDVKNSVCNDRHEVHKASKDNSGALPAVGAEQEEEDAESPWDSEVTQADSEVPRKTPCGVLLPAAERHRACSQIVSGESDNGFLEKRSNSQLNTPISALEMNETSPKNRQQKSDLLQEFVLEDVEDIEGEYSGSTFHMSSAAEKEDKDAIENYGVWVEKEKSKERCFNTQTMSKEENVDKLNTQPGNITNQQMKEKLTLRNKGCLKMEDENTTEEKVNKNFLPEESEFALNHDVAKENKGQASKQKANQQMSSSSGNNFRVPDDSTSSEASQEGRPAAKKASEKNKVSIQMDVTDDLDLTHSSETTSEDVKLPTSTYKDAVLLLEQLTVDHTGSAILLKIQNILLKYEQIIEHEKNRYATVWREVKRLESEKEESKLRAEENQDLKSILAHQEVEWKSDIQSLKFTLKQEEEKRLRVETLYEKTREKLRRKEEQYCKEIEEKQQLELQSRNLEMELVTLRKLFKQVEDERDETQRQLSQEKSARALQEGILNNHLWRQKELEEETRRTIGKSSDESDTEREKDLLYKNQLLQDEIAMLRLELDQIRLRHQEEEGKYLEENETLKEKNEDLQKELKLNEETLTQTVFQYNGQLNLLKTESAMLTSKLEQTKESKDRLETEIESFRSRLNTTVQELERHQSSKSDAERTFQRERDEWLRLQDKLNHDLSDVREANKSLSQQLSKAESKANSLENELHQLRQTFREKTLLLEMTQKELSQSQCQAKEYDRARQLEKDQVNKLTIKQESLQERLGQLQSENLLLRQQLEDLQNKGIIKEKVVNDVQDRFNDIFNKLRADTEKQVYLVEERNKELNAKCTDLREQVFKYETDKIEREGMIRQLQQELADALKKQSMSEASLEVTTRYRSDLEEDKLCLQKELEKAKTKLQEVEEKYLNSERCVRDLKTALDDKEREATASALKLQDQLLASSETNTTIKQLEEHVQHLEIENTRLEATVQQQSNRIEALQRDLQASDSVHNRLEDLIMSLQTAQAAAEDHHKQVQKQNVLALTSKDLQSMWEEQFKSRSNLEERVAQLDREKADLFEQCESERKKVKKLVELKRPVELRLDQEMRRNLELQKDFKRLKRLLSRATKKIRVYEEREMESQLNLKGEMKSRYSEMVSEVDRLRTKVAELSQQLDMESKKSMQLEAQNRDLQEELSTLQGNCEKLEKSKCQLKEQVAKLQHHLETNMVDHSQIEQYKREVDERAGQEIRQKLQEVNLFLQAQAASQDRLEHIRASHHASLRNQLKDRIRDLECELDKIKNTQQESFPKECAQAEVEKYKELYQEEVKTRRCLAKKLERANERLEEANAKLLRERQKSKSLITSSIVGGGLAATPVLYSTALGHLGSNLGLSRSLSLGGSFLSPSENTLSSRNRVAAFVAKVRQELDEKITKELEEATAELETGCAGSSKNLHVDQDPLCRAIEEYRDVLTKNYMI
ncbi:ankyrin repeat domain-containing protein 26-like isoform X6 [Parus major]|uniref:ankyrin repeat domain-containing protein 26-like isoform X6 n=1 Tax=Parus major TaxID=9157 RepID=UPI00077166CA|nr:ankyrin repeat domain-containing protein 26-like isoform X6 [Parus major]